MKSPLKAKPLRNPGQSLQERLINLVFDQIFVGFMLIVAVLPMMLFSWWIWQKNTIPDPVPVTVVSSILIIYGLTKILRAVQEAKSVKLGMSGEKAVGQFLEKLRANGAIVFHDIVGDNFNLDHVVISKSGIYVIETKTMSKPNRGKPELAYDGKQIFRNNKPILGDPIKQVTAASSWLRDILENSTGKRPVTRPVVVFPGWYINNTAKVRPPVWVLNPKALPTFMQNAEECIAPEDVHLFAFHLCRYIRGL